MKEEYKPIPVKSAQEIGKQFNKDQVIILAWDRKSGLAHFTTWGNTMEDKKQAAQGSERIAKFLGVDNSRREVFEDELGLLSKKP